MYAQHICECRCGTVLQIDRAKSTWILSGNLTFFEFFGAIKAVPGLRLPKTPKARIHYTTGLAAGVRPSGLMNQTVSTKASISIVSCNGGPPHLMSLMCFNNYVVCQVDTGYSCKVARYKLHWIMISICTWSGHARIWYAVVIYTHIYTSPCVVRDWTKRWNNQQRGRASRQTNKHQHVFTRVHRQLNKPTEQTN